MQRNESIQQELAEINSTLAGFSNATPYPLPEGYFESFPEKMLALVTSMEQPAYQTASQEISDLSPLLSGLKSKGTFQVPDTYFAQLAKEVVASVKEPAQAPAPVISINRRFTRTSWKRYAAAAAVIGFIGIATLFMWNRTPDRNQSLANLQDLPNDNTEIPELSEEILANYLKALPGNENTQPIDSADAEYYDLALLKVDDTKLVNILESVPEEELANYEMEL